MKLKTLTQIGMITMLLAASNALAIDRPVAPAVEGQNGNGGGGVNRNGRYMTFYSAGFYTEPNEATASEIPQLPELMNFFSSTPLSAATKAKYLSALTPLSDRTYYKVQPGTFTPEIRARLLAEYSRVMKVDTNELALFAITDTTSKATYLFPEFFSLKPVEQMAILFHEAYWIIKPSVSYQQVIQAEMTFQAYLENPTSPDRLLHWLATTGTPGDVMAASIQFDLRNKTMQGLLKGNSLALGQLLGAPFIQCMRQTPTIDCSGFVAINAYQLAAKYPSSLFLKFFNDLVSRKGFELIGYGRGLHFGRPLLGEIPNCGGEYYKSPENDDAYLSNLSNLRIDLTVASYQEVAAFKSSVPGCGQLFITLR